MTFDEVRARFPVLGRCAYLNAGTFGPLSRGTAEAVADQTRRDVEEGRAGGPYFERMTSLRDDIRARIAGLLGTAPDRIALTDSTTTGCRLVLLGLRLRPDDEVVTTDAEHFGLIGPLAASGATVRVARVQGRSADQALDAILGEVGPRTRLLALSHVAWTTGQVLPVAELRESTGVPTLVDGAQGAGAIELDVEALGCDFYTVSAQKWLCGPDATGALYVRDPDSIVATLPSYFSQAAYDLEAVTWEPKPGAPRFDHGWIPITSLAGLAIALAEPPEWRFEHARAAAARCRALLLEHGHDVVTEPDQAALVAWRARDGEDAPAVAARALAQGVVIRDLPTTGWLRASCGYWTSDDDLARLVAAL